MKDRVHLILDEAFQDFRYGSFGLLLLTCFTYAQRVSSVNKLEWSSTDMEKGTITFNKKTVFLTPVLKDLISAQKNLWDFQPYVFAYHRPSDNAYRPISKPIFDKYMLEICEKLGIAPLTHLEIFKSAVRELLCLGAHPFYVTQLSGLTEKGLSKYFENDPEILNRIVEMRNGSTSYKIKN